VRLRFVVPADVHTPTGGNVYDLAVVEAMRRDGDEVDVVRCEPWALAAVLARPWSGRTLVDGLLACTQPDAVAGGNASVLVHMPIALETGLSPDRARELDELEGRALNAASLVVATSDWTARHLARHHGVRNVSVAAPGVETAAASRGSDPPLLVHCAAILPHKDQLGVVAALSGLTGLRWQARLVGAADRDLAYAAAVRRAVADAGLGTRVEIPGVLTRDCAWAGADLALLPSRVESYGMVVTEALARGVPALVSEGGAVEALGVTEAGEVPGLVVPPGDPGALALALRRWLTDTGLRSRLRAAALSRRPSLHSWTTTADRIRAALARL
jgi:glycosyltransferase involved in cell wall biosynthesis